MKPNISELWELRTKIDSLPKGLRTNEIENYAQKTGVSRHTIYRWMRKSFGNKKYVKKRKKIGYSLIDEVLKIKRKAIESGYSYSKFSTPYCINQLVKRKVEGAEKLKVSTVNRRLEEIGFFIKNNKYYKGIKRIKKYEKQINADLQNIAAKLRHIQESGLLKVINKEDIFDYAEDVLGLPRELTAKIFFLFEINKKLG